MLTDFQNSFTDRLSVKFATNSYLNMITTNFCRKIDFGPKSRHLAN